MIVPDKGNRKYIEHIASQLDYFNTQFENLSEYKLENWRKSYLDRIFKSLDLDSNVNNRFLDIGVGGSGYTTIEAARQKTYSFGIDLSFPGIMKAHFFSKSTLSNDTYCNFLVCLAEKLPFKSRTFNKICSIAVLSHVFDDVQMIAEISRVTKTGGKVFIQVPNSFKRIFPLFWLPYYLHDKKIGQLRHYTIENLSNKFEKNGFLLIDEIYTGHLVKVKQFFLTKCFPWLEENNSQVWWNLEKQDL